MNAQTSVILAFVSLVSGYPPNRSFVRVASQSWTHQSSVGCRTQAVVGRANRSWLVDIHVLLVVTTATVRHVLRSSTGSATVAKS